MTDIDELLARLNPKTRQQFVKASETENRLLPTPSLNLNRAIKGFGFGRQSMLWGNKGTGKTAFCIQQAAIAQSLGEGVAWIDAEKNFDKEWVTRLGADPETMAVSKITSIADMADACYDVIKAGFGYIVVDSISALLPQSYFEDTKEGKGMGEMKSLVNTGQIGTFSKNMGSACNMLNNINKDAALVLVSQVRNQIGNNGATMTHMGGKAVEHMNSTTIKLWCTPSKIGELVDKVTEGNKIYTKPVGHPVTWSVDKNRGPGTKATDEYNFYFNGYNLGVDRTGEIIDAAVEFGLVNKSGNWYKIDEGKSYNGKPEFTKWLKGNAVEEDLYGEIIAQSI